MTSIIRMALSWAALAELLVGRIFSKRLRMLPRTWRRKKTTKMRLACGRRRHAKPALEYGCSSSLNLDCFFLCSVVLEFSVDAPRRFWRIPLPMNVATTRSKLTNAGCLSRFYEEKKGLLRFQTIDQYKRVNDARDVTKQHILPWEIHALKSTT